MRRLCIRRCEDVLTGLFPAEGDISYVLQDILYIEMAEKVVFLVKDQCSSRTKTLAPVDGLLEDT